MSKTVWTSKTIWVNTITLVAGVVGYLVGHELLADQESLLAILVAVSGALNIGLRFLTTKPLK